MEWPASLPMSSIFRWAVWEDGNNFLKAWGVHEPEVNTIFVQGIFSPVLNVSPDS